jgi:hypothetical protein
LRVALGLIERLLVLPERARIEVTAELRAELVTLRRAGADLVELAVVVRERPVVDLEPELLLDRLAGLLLDASAGPGRTRGSPPSRTGSRCRPKICPTLVPSPAAISSPPPVAH